MFVEVPHWHTIMSPNIKRTNIFLFVVMNTRLFISKYYHPLLIHTGNNWGVDAVTGLSGLGYGPQEQFYGCADVTIVGNGAQTTTSSTTTTSTAATTTTIPSSPTGDKSTRTSTTQLPVTSSTGDLLVTSKPNCFAVNEFAGDKSMDSWCEINCKRGFCPETHCKC